MTFAPKRLLGLAGGITGLAFLVGAAPADAVTIGPNFCLAGSTTTSCGIQLDIPNAALQPYTGPYVHGQVTIVDSGTLRFSFTGLSSGSFGYFFDNVALDLVPVSTFTGTFVSGTWGASQGGPGGHTAGSALTSADVHFGADLDEGSFGHSFGVVSESAGGSQGFSSSLSALAFDVTWGSGTNC